MGYDLHITRAEEWIYNEGREISKEEWLAYVESDPELSLVPKNGDCFTDWNVDLADYEIKESCQNQEHGAKRCLRNSREDLA
ncbi:MAG: hypothetical protein KC917_22550 [Candidatus Omnitrophica bacterium]|nr:hypothetical protein [Candidatus Omnitrophota bacterium]